MDSKTFSWTIFFDFPPLRPPIKLLRLIYFLSTTIWLQLWPHVSFFILHIHFERFSLSILPFLLAYSFNRHVSNRFVNRQLLILLKLKIDFSRKFFKWKWRENVVETVAEICFKKSSSARHGVDRKWRQVLEMGKFWCYKVLSCMEQYKTWIIMSLYYWTVLKKYFEQTFSL